jgi:hypothetical protein
LNIGALDGIVFAEVHLDVLAESTWIVVPDGFAVSEGFEEGVAWEDFFLDWVMLFLVGEAVGMAEWG